MKGKLFRALLGGSWVVISGLISKVTIVTTPTHEPPSVYRASKQAYGLWP